MNLPANLSANGSARITTNDITGMNVPPENGGNSGNRMRMVPPTIPRESQPDYHHPLGLPSGGYSPFASSGFSPMNYGMPFGTSAALPYSPLAYRLNATPTSFVRLAEQQARPAFETLESTLQAVSSVLMVLESAYFTISNSFRAVLSIVDQFGRLKVQLKRITEAFVLLRLLKRAILCLRAKLLGIEAASKVDGADDCNESGDRPMSWPVLLFLLVAIGGPFLVWKLISSMLNLNVDCDSWRTGESEHYVAVADYDYTAEHNDELTVSSGDELRVAPKHLQPNIRGWLLAAAAKGECVGGLLPANYVHIVGHVRSSADRTQSNAAANQNASPQNSS